MKKSSNCRHCDPYISNPSHISERLEGFMFPVVRMFTVGESFIKRKFPNAFIKLNKSILSGVLKFLFTLRILQEVDVPEGESGSSHNRTLVIVREAQKRGIPIKPIKVFGKRGTNYFSMVIHGKKIFFEGLPTVEITDVTLTDFDNKHEFKKLLKAHDLPYARGECFNESILGLLFVKNNSFPVVVKPKSGSLSKHTTCDIRDESTLQEAMRIAQIIEREFIVEEFIKGDVHRITLVDGNVVASCLREPPNVVGDGIHTLDELIVIKNRDPRRGYAHQKNFTLHKIPSSDSEKAAALLLQQDVRGNTVIPHGKKIYLHDKVTLSAGADIHDTTDIIHQDNISLFKKVYDICNAPVIGIDFIIDDISRSHRTEQCAILEVNSLPYIDMHHSPVTGTPRNVAGHILDYCISRG